MAKRKIKFSGICTDAETLGVSRAHLYKVLIRERPSSGLLIRYHELKEQQKAEASK